MLRDKLLHHEPIDGFRWRSHEITRIEGFSDAVFGFAVTLLIVSLEVPHTSTELLETMRGFGAFVATFIMLTGMWRAQFTFFRRYGLEDNVTVALNLVLLFTVLFFVYPLKFLFGVMLTQFHVGPPLVLPEHKKWIFLIFAAGYSSVFTIFALLYRHAYNQRERLELNEFEVFETKHSIKRMTLVVFVGLAYFGVALLETLPRRTPGEKRLLFYASIATLVLFAVLLMRMIRLVRERRRVRKEWLSRPSEPQVQAHE
ncbi:MAG TPA: TMEM175 family protein [Thermoanaerobaculia bacterium]|nr:TMEM175 family protein [Thermoanaerobaculia bacterium]